LTPPLEPRLQRRYQQLVLEHLHVSDPLAAGIHALATATLADGFAAVLGAHRFLHNQRAGLPDLAQPLHQLVYDWRRQEPATWALNIHDWSTLSYHGHTRKSDQTQLTNKKSKGYELTTLLLVEGRSGQPVAPLEIRLRAAKAVYSTRIPTPDSKAFRIDEVLASMQAVADLKLPGPLVHVIDREADGLAHYRAWQAAGHFFLVRAKGGRIVRWQGNEVSLANLAQRLTFRRCRDVTYKGQTAVQHVAETTVVLDRPGWRQRRTAGQRTVNQRVPGEPITLRLVVSRVCDATGQTLAVWYLFTNVPAEVATATVALWYYWRWRIESLFKLFKSAGQQVEHWQQQGGEALAKRLLVAAMACALVWQLERLHTPAGATLRVLLVRLSGRQMQHGRESTAPALLAGMWSLLAMLEVLEEHSVEELRGYRDLLLGKSQEDSG
jgi:Transposase DDE domain